MEKPVSNIALAFKGGKESVFSCTIAESVGPLRSFLLYSAYKISGGRIRPDLSKYFSPKKLKDSEPNVEQEKTYDILQAIDERLGHGDVPEKFIGNNYSKWTALKSRTNSYFNSATTLSDYVLFDREDSCHYLFAVRNSQLLPIKIQASGYNEENNNSQIAETTIREILIKEDTGEMSNLINTELAISNFVKSSAIKPENCTIRRISSVTSDFPCQRHLVFEREGQMFTELRHKGAWSIGELQELHRVLFSRGIYFEPKTKEVIIDQDLGETWIKLRKISLDQKSGLEDTQARSEMKQYAGERLYFEMVLHFFKENPKLIDLFLQTPEYQKFSMEFKDKNLSALGLTERAVAENMFANYYLSMFEGVAIEHSPSQIFLSHIPDFHQTIKDFISSHSEIAAPLPKVVSIEKDQPTSLQNLFILLKKADYPFTKTRLGLQKKTEVLANVTGCFPAIQHQIERNEFNQNVLTKLKQKSIPVSEKGIFTTVVSNIMLAKIPGEKRFTISSWLTHADQYLTEGKPLPSIPVLEMTPTIPAVTEKIRYIFNGEISQGHSAYDSQEKRIFENASIIFSYLQNNEEIPENVKNFVKTLGSTDLIVRILERFGSISKNDPLIINRFFPDGFAEFQKSSIYRYIFEFVRGVETNLILTTSKSSREIVSRKFGGRWKNNVFSNIDNSILTKAIQKTVFDASHRIDILNHEQGVKRKTLKDWQEHFEKMFGWDTFDMWLLRWEKFWDVWNTLGGAWDCICFSRKSIFNPHTLQQW